MAGKRIPYGISNYQTIAREGYLYVDKTRFIRVLEENQEPFVFFLRPRRFGKSLFVSLLSNYYDRLQKGHFDEFFTGTDIWKNPTSKRGSYYILNFDFSGISTSSENQLVESFSRKIHNYLNLFLAKYDIPITLQTHSSPADVLAEFFSLVSTRIEGQIYVIVDEYDHFAHELLGFDIDLFHQSLGGNGFIRKWFEVLKEATTTVVGRIFATGVSPITLDSLTSGFNIARDLTRSPRLHEMMGFTESEVTWLIHEALPEELIFPGMMETLREYYDGYCFSEDGTARLFNSDMVLYYLARCLDRQKPPEKLLDSNIISDYSKLEKLMRIKAPDQNFSVLTRITSDGFVSANLTEIYTLDISFSEDDFISLLFYLGLLTIQESLPGRVQLKTPNYVIHGLYHDFMMQMISREAGLDVQSSVIADAIYQIAYSGKCDKLVSLVEEILHAFSNRDYIGFDEKYLKILIFAYAHMSTLYLVKSEYEVAGGYIDIAFLPREPWHPDYYALFELKYIKSGQSSPEAINRALEDGILQMTRYGSAPEWAAMKKVKRWVLVFAGDKCVHNREVTP